jgi:hypothetical protein
VPQFFPDVRYVIGKMPKDETNFKVVQVKLGKYLYKCEPPVVPQNGDEYFRCWYDIRGDNTYMVVVYFNKDNSIIRGDATMETS